MITENVKLPFKIVLKSKDATASAVPESKSVSRTVSPASTFNSKTFERVKLAELEETAQINTQKKDDTTA